MDFMAFQLNTLYVIARIIPTEGVGTQEALENSIRSQLTTDVSTLIPVDSSGTFSGKYTECGLSNPLFRF